MEDPNNLMCTTTTNLRLFIETQQLQRSNSFRRYAAYTKFYKKIVTYLRYSKRKNTSRRTDTASIRYRAKIRDMGQISLLLPPNKSRVPPLPDNMLSVTGSCISNAVHKYPIRLLEALLGIMTGVWFCSWFFRGEGHTLRWRSPVPYSRCRTISVPESMPENFGSWKNAVTYI